ncbi:MAG: hypothetical protein ACTTI6_02530 [Treponema sp.]|mgnify:FL=1|uniref:hypothetical protein n=1 Tax=Treponema sp. TaxID=166 RepID=UPI003FA33CB3
MSDTFSVIQALGLLAQTVGLITIAIKTGNWKGVTENRISNIEKELKEMKVEVSQLEDMQKELMPVLIGLQKDMEYVRKSVDKLNEQREDYAEKKYR